MTFGSIPSCHDEGLVQLNALWSIPGCHLYTRFATNGTYLYTEVTENEGIYPTKPN